MEDYPWYKVVGSDDDLEQGDFLDSCPVIIPSGEVRPGHVDAVVNEYNVVIMSQSCDLKYKKIELVLVCPVLPLGDIQKSNPFYCKKEGREALRQGYVPGYHVLDRCDLEGFSRGFMVVDFHNVYGVWFDNMVVLARRASRRLRLLPPYKEHLSQAFARFFMRVGLPVTIGSLPLETT